MTQLNSEEQINQRQQLLSRARKGVLQFLKEKGGAALLAEMHDFSLNKYLIQHQAFSGLMESLVDEGLVEFDFGTQAATITESGLKFISQIN